MAARAPKNELDNQDEQEEQPKKKVRNTGKSGQPAANDTVKYRAYPNDTQYEQIARTIGCARYYWNLIYDLALITYEEHGVSIYPTPAQAKTWEECSWLADVDSLALSNVQLNYQQSWTNHKTNPKHFSRPTYKVRHGLAGSYTTNNQPKWNKETKTFETKGSIRIENHKIYLPKVGWVKINEHVKIPDDCVIKNVTVSRDCAGKIFVSVGFWNPELEQLMKDAGLDTTKDQLIITGLDYSNPYLFVNESGLSPTDVHYYKKSQAKLAKLQKKLARREPGSSNYKKLNQRIARLHRKIANQRLDLLHKLSLELALSCDVVVVEDLDLKALSKRKRGGRFSFGKSVSDNAWGKFLTLLEYKLSRRHGQLIKVSRWFPSSKKCHHCGTLYEELGLSDRSWKCPECGTVHDRDVNAAWNLVLEGVRMLRAGEVAGVSLPDAVSFSCAGGMPVAATSPESPGGLGCSVVPVEGCETREAVLKYCAINTSLSKGKPDLREAGIKEVATATNLAVATEAATEKSSARSANVQWTVVHFA